MKKQITILLIVVGMLISAGSVKAMSPVGAPSTSLEKGEIELAYDYTEATIQNIEADLLFGSFFLEDVESQLSTYTLTCNVASNLSYFLRFGSVDTQANKDYNFSEHFRARDQWNLDTNLLSVGAKANLFTIYKDDKKQEKLTIGFTLQGTYMKFLGDRVLSYTGNYYGYSYSDSLSVPVTIEMFEGKFAFGPTYTNGKLAIYGCPVLYYLHGKGNQNFDGYEVPFTIDTTTVLGCLGGSFQITDDLTIRGEYQFGGNDYKTVSCGLAYKF